MIPQLTAESLAKIRDDVERGDRERHVYVDHCAVLLAALDNLQLRVEDHTRETLEQIDALTTRVEGYEATGARLGMATTVELLDEVRVRLETSGLADYRTVDG